jgi:hypothetical protein
MYSYRVWNNNNVVRDVSAESPERAASIFLMEDASPTPRRAEEAQEPACYVAPVGMPKKAVAFWRAGSGVQDGVV